MCLCSIYQWWSLLCLLGRCERPAPVWFACHLCPCRCRDLHVERPTTYQTPLLVAGHGAHPLGRSAATVALQWFSCPIPSTAGTPTGLGRRSPHSCWRHSASNSRLLRGRSSCPARYPGVPVVVQAAAAAGSKAAAARLMSVDGVLYCPFISIVLLIAWLICFSFICVPVSLLLFLSFRLFVQELCRRLPASSSLCPSCCSCLSPRRHGAP